MAPELAAMQRQADLSALSGASGALWLATLSLMTAFMHTTAPAHRYLLAARIARNLSTLSEQECFSEVTRAKFSRLAVHWREKADALSPNPRKRRGMFERWLH
jgi:hypothetical protein